MGLPAEHPPTLSLVTAFSRHPAALDWARARLVDVLGPIALESPAFDFRETEYYTATMGAGITKRFWAFERPFAPEALVDLKLATNRWEEDYARTASHGEPRPLNLDPGYMTLGKLVLASTKDFAHRLYLGKGIYAEVTLFYRRQQWQHHEFTFADYRRADYQAFFTQCRDWLHARLREREAPWAG
jgi:hypothetical protein